jgi:hypothetical protein
MLRFRLDDFPSTVIRRMQHTQLDPSKDSPMDDGLVTGYRRVADSVARSAEREAICNEALQIQGEQRAGRTFRAHEFCMRLIVAAHGVPETDAGAVFDQAFAQPSPIRLPGLLD